MKLPLIATDSSRPAFLKRLGDFYKDKDRLLEVTKIAVNYSVDGNLEIS